MLLSNIKIENFKSIKKIEINLKANSNGLGKDILLGRFKGVDSGKWGVPGYIAIFGRNAIGKTSILEAISYVSSFYNGNIIQTAITELNNELNGNFTVNPLTNTIGRGEPVARERILKGINEGGEFYQRYLKLHNEIIQATYIQLAKDANKEIKIELGFSFEDQGDAIYKFSQYGTTITSSAPTEHLEKINNWLTSILIESSNIYTHTGNVVVTSKSSRISNDHIYTSSTILPSLRKSLTKEKVDKLISLPDQSIKKVTWVKNNLGKYFAEKVISGEGPISIQTLSAGTYKFLELADRILIPLQNKDIKLVLIDEIELSLHKELVACLRMLMNEMFNNHGVQYIFTTHNPLVVKDGSSYKQILSLEMKGDEHIAEKLSKSLKPSQSIVNQYEKDLFAFYPDKEYARNVISSIVV